MSNRLDEMRQGARRQRGRSLSQMVQQASNAQSGHAPAWEWVPVDSVVVDDDIQVRVGGLNEDTVQQYAVIMYESGGWGPFPAVDLHYDRHIKAYLLSAGFHRWAASRLASQWLIKDGKPGIDEIKATLRPGGREGALDFAEQDNLANALALSNRDKRNIFERRLLRGHSWSEASDRAIARELGVDHKTIGNWRRKLQDKATGENSPVIPDTRVGADGREYNVENVRKSNRQRTGEATQAEKQQKVLAHLGKAVQGLDDLNLVDEANGLHDWRLDLARMWGLNIEGEGDQ